MTTLLQRLADDLLAARKEDRIADRDGLLYLLAEARMPGKRNGNRDSTDAEVIEVIRKQISQNEDLLAALKGTPREIGPEQQKALADIERLTAYLPPQMTEADLTLLIEAFIIDDQKSMKMMGSVMTMLRETHPGQYDPAVASRVARSLLQG